MKKVEKGEQREGEEGEKRREKQREEGRWKADPGGGRAEEEKRNEERRRKELQVRIKVAFWNVAGLGNKGGIFGVN